MMNFKHHREPLKGALSREDAAEYLSISAKMIDRLYQSGRLPRIKLGRSTRYRIKDLDSFLEKSLEFITKED